MMKWEEWSLNCANQRSMFASPKTWSYIDYDVASSAFQKCIRRSIWPDAFYWALELYWTGTFGKKNIWNRVLNASLEDIGPADPTLFMFISEQLYMKDELNLACAVYLLTTTKKCRTNDWVSCTSDHSLYEKVKYRVTPDDYLNLRYALAGGDRCIIMQWLDRIYFSDKADKPSNNIFAILSEFYPKRYVSACIAVERESTWRYNVKSRLLFTHLMNCKCYNLFTKEDYTTEEYFNRYAPMIDEFNSILGKAYNRETQLEIKDFYLDKHTKAGRSLGRGIEHFVNEAGILIPEDEHFQKDSKFIEDIVCEQRGIPKRK